MATPRQRKPKGRDHFFGNFFSQHGVVKCCESPKDAPDLANVEDALVAHSADSSARACRRRRRLRSALVFCLRAASFLATRAPRARRSRTWVVEFEDFDQIDCP